MSLFSALLGATVFRSAARRASDWVDLQWSLIVELLGRVAPQARGRLLDVGCGHKPYADIFLPYVDEYLGIEREDSFAGTAASSIDGRGPDLLFDGTRLPFDDATFDTVLSVQVLEHTPRPAALVAEMARVLKPDGLLILSAPFQFRLHEQPHDYFRYSPHGLRTLCDDAGLEVVEVHAQGSLWSVLAHKVNSYLALRVARASGLAQAMGKLGHENVATTQPRLWTLPLVGPLMVGNAAAARVLDRVLPEPDETLGFLTIARPRRSGP